MNDLLRRYIFEIITGSSQVDEDELQDDDGITEFSGVGAVAGFTAPLGLSGQDMEGPRVKERKRRKKPTWK